MRIILTFLLNAGLNFAVGLAIAAVLGPGDYGRFAVGATAAAVLATGLFDWLRLSTTRFYGDRQQKSDANLRPTLDGAYAALAVLVVLGAIVVACFGINVGMSSGLAGAVALCGVANGVFDYQAAVARARFEDRAYALLVITKSILGLVFAIGAALALKEPAAVLAAQALGTLIAILPVRRHLAEPAGIGGRMDRSRLKGFAAYGIPVVIANVLFQVILLMNRSAAASNLGYAAAGQLSLATDVSLRLLLAAGAAIDVFVFQIAVRREAEGGMADARRQLRHNIAIVVAVLVLLGVGYASILPAFDALVVPVRYRTDFVWLSITVLPGILLFCLGQFAINPVFQIAGKTGPIIAGALVSLGLDGTGILLLPSDAGLGAIAALHSLSLGLGCVAVTAVALWDKEVRPDMRDLGAIVLAGGAMAIALWPTRSIGSPLLSLFAAAVVGPAVFAAVLIALDAIGLRAVASAALARFERRGPVSAASGEVG